MARIAMSIRDQCMQLAQEIDEFTFDCCPDTYVATDEERRDNIDDIALDIAKGNVGYLSDYVSYEKKQKEHYTLPDFMNRADNILKLLAGFAR